MRRFVLILALLTGGLGFSPLTGSVSACPMCRMANEADQASEAENARPRAYMYSILFMLSMPAVLFASFSLGFYRLWKQQQAISSIDIAPDDTHSDV